MKNYWRRAIGSILLYGLSVGISAQAGELQLFKFTNGNNPQNQPASLLLIEVQTLAERLKTELPPAFVQGLRLPIELRIEDFAANSEHKVGAYSKWGNSILLNQRALVKNGVVDKNLLKRNPLSSFCGFIQFVGKAKIGRVWSLNTRTFA